MLGALAAGEDGGRLKALEKELACELALEEDCRDLIDVGERGGADGVVTEDVGLPIGILGAELSVLTTGLEALEDELALEEDCRELLDKEERGGSDGVVTEDVVLPIGILGAELSVLTACLPGKPEGLCALVENDEELELIADGLDE